MTTITCPICKGDGLHLMTAAETLHHIRAVIAGGDTPAMALWKINRILEGREPQGLPDNWTEALTS